jgi:hypothetical protein
MNISVLHETTLLADIPLFELYFGVIYTTTSDVNAMYKAVHNVQPIGKKHPRPDAPMLYDDTEEECPSSESILMNRKAPLLCKQQSALIKTSLFNQFKQRCDGKRVRGRGAAYSTATISY